MIESIYDKSYVDVTDFQLHTLCTEYLEILTNSVNSTLSDIFTAVDSLMDSYCFLKMGNECFECTSYLLGNVTKFQSEMYSDIFYDLTACNWVKETWNYETNEGRYSSVETALSAALQHDNYGPNRL